MSQLVDSNSPTGICSKLQLDGLPTIINTNPSPGFKVLTDGLRQKQYRLRIKTRTQMVRGQYKKSNASLHAIIHRSSSISFNVHISTSSHVVSGFSAKEMLIHHDQFCSTRTREVLHMIDAWACHNPHSEKLKALATHYCLALSLSLVIFIGNPTKGIQLSVPRSLSPIYP